MGNMRLAGNKIGFKPQFITGISLPQQRKQLTRNVIFDPFTSTLGMTAYSDIEDAFGFGFAMHPTNLLGTFFLLIIIRLSLFSGLNMKTIYSQLADLPTIKTDGLHQPFTLMFGVGSEFDFVKGTGTAISMDVPLPGLNEIFDFDVRAEGIFSINKLLLHTYYFIF